MKLNDIGPNCHLILINIAKCCKTYLLGKIWLLSTYLKKYFVTLDGWLKKGLLSIY